MKKVMSLIIGCLFIISFVGCNNHEVAPDITPDHLISLAESSFNLGIHKGTLAGMECITTSMKLIGTRVESSIIAQGVQDCISKRMETEIEHYKMLLDETFGGL